MFKKNIKPILMAGALALATAVSPVLAVDGGEPVEETPTTSTSNVSPIKPIDKEHPSITISKTFNVPSGIVSFENQKVTFTITPSYGAPSYDFSAGTSKDNSNQPFLTFNLAQSDKKQFDIIFDPSTATPGTYTYTISEAIENLSETEEAVTTNDGRIYTVTVRVVNSMPEDPQNANAKYIIDQITITTPGVGNGSTEIVVPGDNQDSAIKKYKYESVGFINYYNEYNDLTIEKQIKGDYAETEDKFNFTVNLTLPDTTTIKEYNVTADNGLITSDLTNEGKLQFTDDGNGVYTATIKATLADEDEFTIVDLPAGTIYTVVEDETDYAESYVINGGTSVDEKTTGEKTLTDTDTTVTFTNTKNSSPLTGVIVNNMPYIALLGASGAGLVVLAASKKRSKK